MAHESRQRNPKLTIGEVNQLHFSLSWQKDDGTEGELSTFLGDENVWGGDEGFRWTLGEVLVFLVRGLDSLRYRQSLPFPGMGNSPFQLKESLEERWAQFERGPSLHEEEDWFQFEQKHNLAHAFEGAHPRPLYFLREGNLFRLWFDKQTNVYPYGRTLSTLIDLGNAIYERAKTDQNFLAIYPEVKTWNTVKRSVADMSSALALSLNLDQEEIPKLTKGRNEREFLEVDNFFDSELMAAARMTSEVLSVEAISNVIEEIKKVGRHKQTHQLDTLSEKALQVLENFANDQPYLQGYALAKWFRSLMLPQSNGKPLAFDVIIKSWSVTITEVTCNEKLDAIAVWGPRRGPAILLNLQGKHNRKEGRRSTLAHEICHLLLDRQTSIPFGEVLGGTVPYTIEARAKAFAAELILPRSEAVKLWFELSAQGRSAEQCVNLIKRAYQATIHITAHQLLNSGDLDKRSLRELHAYFSNVQMFE